MITIICSAIHYDDGRTDYIHKPKNITSGFVICGRRHHDCIYILSILMQNYDPHLAMRENQGFLTSDNRFVSRHEAYVVAKDANQLLHNLHDPKDPYLTSEDIY